MTQAMDAAAGQRSGQAQDEFRLGLAFMKNRQWKTAVRHFRIADDRCPRRDARACLYRSYHGLALVSCGEVSGLNLCRSAASQEKSRADVFHNLALAEIRLKHRRRACDAIAAGLSIDPRNTPLLALRNRLGTRRKPCVPFLNRNNPLNKWLGKVTYRSVRRRAAMC